MAQSMMAVWLAIAYLQSASVPAFDVASVKASTPAGVLMMRGGPGTDSPGQMTYSNATVRMLVAKAWDLKAYQLTGPNSMDTARFDIVAKIAPGTSRQNFMLMLQHLLVTRIGLVVHHESKEMPVFEMRIAKGGLKLKEAEPAREGASVEKKISVDGNGFAILPPGIKAGNESAGVVARISARLYGLPELLEMMERHGGRPVIDRTGLTGKYDYTLAFSRDSSALYGGLPAMGAGSKGQSAEASQPAPAFLEAVEQQLGLKLLPAKAPIDIVTVDSFNRSATEN